MKCNNEYCYFQGFGECCHESEEGHANATPNQLDCPSSLRKDFDECLQLLAAECKKMIDKKCFRELIEIIKFMKQQGTKPAEPNTTALDMLKEVTHELTNALDLIAMAGDYKECYADKLASKALDFIKEVNGDAE